MATLQELQTSWNVEEVADANDLLDAYEEAEAEANRKAER